MRFSLFTALFTLATHAAASEVFRFPDGFNWCVATAGHQIEGGNVHSDWWEWEQRPGTIAHGDRSGLASNSWAMTEQDLGILGELNATQYRFSVEWAKIEPQQGRYDEAAIEHYRQFVEKLALRGVRPMITLQHFVMPMWFRSLGGWEWEGAPGAFAKFTRLVRQRIAPNVRDFITVNEPMVNVMGGYFLGNVPPGEKRAMKDVVPVIVGLLKSHVAAYQVLHENGADVRVGMAHHLRVFDPEQWFNPMDRLIAGVLDRNWNWALPDAMETGVLRINIPGAVNAKLEITGLKGTHDFVGVNYYTRERVNSGVYIRSLLGKPTASDQERVSRLYLPANWEIYPKGLERLLVEADRRYKRPTAVTENGIDDAADSKRPGYLKGHLEAVHRAIEKGVKVDGYCHWSMIDNFEWLHGFTPRFGLYSVDYATYARTPRASALQFSKYARENEVGSHP